MLANPFYAIEIAPSLGAPHDPLVPEDQWIAANVQTINEVGPEQWLRDLLDALKEDVIPDGYRQVPL